MEQATNILSSSKMPFCPGCGHSICVRNIAISLEDLGYASTDVVLVSDIGCAGLVDPLFTTHTIHGLHGRAPALGVGVSLGLQQPSKKVLVIQGDGGATIGLQHILEAARRNIDMTLVIFNNLLYGMTGGQMSGLSTNPFKSYKYSDDEAEPYNVVNLAHQAGAAYSVRVNDLAAFKPILKEAIATKGFSIVELTSLCVSHGVKKISELKEFVVHEEKMTNQRKVGESLHRTTTSLLDKLTPIQPVFSATIQKPMGILVAGSAGGGVQSAAKLLAKAAMLCGLYATMKGEYPITVGTGFSAAEVILSPNPIQYTGLEKPDVAIAVTTDGWQKIKGRVAPHTLLYTDASIENTHDNSFPFLKTAGKKGAALHAIATWLKATSVLPIEALQLAVTGAKYEAELLKAIAQEM